jgi:hypothetical protein
MNYTHTIIQKTQTFFDESIIDDKGEKLYMNIIHLLSSFEQKQRKKNIYITTISYDDNQHRISLARPKHIA